MLSNIELQNLANAIVEEYRTDVELALIAEISEDLVTTLIQECSIELAFGNYHSSQYWELYNLIERAKLNVNINLH